jgi:hypothetical protein
MRKVLYQRSIYRQSLGRYPDASRTAELLEFRTPTVHFTARSGRHLIAVNYHLRIIII